MGNAELSRLNRHARALRLTRRDAAEARWANRASKLAMSYSCRQSAGFPLAARGHDRSCRTF